MGRSEDAIKYLTGVIEIKPDHDKSWFTLASVYESDGNIQEAIKNYEKAIEINSKYSKAYGNLGKLYTIEGEYELAEKTLNNIIKIDDKYADGFMHLGNLYLIQEKYELAYDNLILSINIYDRILIVFQLTTANSLEKWDDGKSCPKYTELQKDLEVVGTNGVYPRLEKVIKRVQKGILMKHTKIEIGENLLPEKSMK